MMEIQTENIIAGIVFVSIFMGLLLAAIYYRGQNAYLERTLSETHDLLLKVNDKKNLLEAKNKALEAELKTYKS